MIVMNYINGRKQLFGNVTTVIMLLNKALN